MMGFVEQIMTNAARATPPWMTASAARAGRQIEEFRGSDWSSMGREMRAVFRAYDRLPPLQYFDVVGRASKDLAPHLVRPMRRELPEALGEGERKIIERWHRTPAITLDTERACVGQQAYAILIHPDPDNPLELTHTTVLGYQLISVEWRSVLGRCEDLRRAQRVRFAVPARLHTRVGDRSETISACSVAEITPDYAILTLPDGQEQGLLAADGSNPLGYIPMVGRRRVRPADRVLWIPEPAYDLQTGCITATLSMADATHTVRVMAPGILVARGPGAKRLKRDMKVQPGSLLAIENEDVQLDWLQGQPIVDAYTKMIDRGLDLMGNLRYLRPGELSGITGAAKSEELGGLFEENETQATEIVEAERALLDVFCDAHNTLIPRAQKLPTEIGHEMGVRFIRARPRQNVLQEAQAVAVAASLGLLDIVNEVADSEQITYERAEELVKDRLKRHRDMIGQGKTPGLDRVAAQIQKPVGQTPTVEENVDDQGEDRDPEAPEG